MWLISLERVFSDLNLECIEVYSVCLLDIIFIEKSLRVYKFLRIVYQLFSTYRQRNCDVRAVIEKFSLYISKF